MKYRICLFMTGIVFQFILVFSAIVYKPVDYLGEPLPVSAMVVGWAIAVLGMAAIPAYVIYALVAANGTLREVNSCVYCCIFMYTG